MSIDEIMNDVTLIRSDISRFSRGTVTLDASSTYAGFDASRITFNANEIFVSVADLPGLTGQTISLDINQATSPTPEPSSLMLLGVGLLGLASLALKKSA